ncbi:MAG: hypothetical protein J0L58_14250 [Burkholderiales bacterium]|nr:hypothetical protein [Burkholderiales bacterium]
MRRRCLIGFAAVQPPFAGAVWAADAPLRLAVGEEMADQRFDFPQLLLQALLHASGLPARLERVPARGTSGMVRRVVDAEADCAVLPSTGGFDPALRPLKMPMRRGLLGARLLLARRERLRELASLRSLAALKRRFVLGYGADWQDAPLMRTLGFKLRVYQGYGELFQALGRGEVDYLHRGVNEVWAEMDHPTLVPHGIAVVPGLALSYPLDDYFHFGPSWHERLPQLQAGARILLESGVYRRLFMSTFGPALQRADFEGRRVLQVVGYGVAPGTPIRDFDAMRLQPTQAELEAG